MFVEGQMVRVAKAISEPERAMLGRVFEFVRMDGTHGYAVCLLGKAMYHLHPEALVPVLPSQAQAVTPPQATQKRVVRARW